METVGLEILGLLFLVALVAGFLDTLAGGGGLIALPALIMCGVPPLHALGTNKLQGSMGTATATFLLLKNGKVKWREVRGLMLVAFVGSALGTVVVQFVDTDVLGFMIPIVLLVIAAYFVVSPTPQNESVSTESSRRAFRKIAVPCIGAYDGMFGPGTGSFFAFAGVALRKQGLVESTAVAKTLNFATNISSLAIFAFSGKLVWAIGGAMILGQAIGATLGSHFLFRINPGVLRWLVVAMCVAMLARYLVTMS